MSRIPASVISVFLLHSTSRALVPGGLPERNASAADLVVVAKPVELQRVKVADDSGYEYELGNFELVRVVSSVSSEGELEDVGDPWDDKVVFRVVRICQMDYHLFKKQDLQLGKTYLLVLDYLAPVECWAPVHAYMVIPENTEQLLRKVRKAVYGSEEEPLATEALPLPKAIEYAGKVMDTTAANLTRHAKRSDEELYEYLDLVEMASVENMMWSRDYVFRHLKGDRRLAYVEIEGTLELRVAGGRRSSPPHGPYSPLAQDINLGHGLPKESEVVASAHGCRFYVTWLRVNAFEFDRALLAVRDVETARGKWKIKAYFKIEAGPAGVPKRRRTASGEENANETARKPSSPRPHSSQADAAWMQPEGQKSADDGTGWPWPYLVLGAAGMAALGAAGTWLLLRREAA